MRPVYHAKSVVQDNSRLTSSSVLTAQTKRSKRTNFSVTSSKELTTNETIYIKDVVKDTQQAIRVPQGKKIKQMQVWRDCLFVVTKRTHQLLYATKMSGLDGKVSLKAHPAFEECRIKKMAFGEKHMFVLTEEGVLFTLGDNEFGQQGVPIS